MIPSYLEGMRYGEFDDDDDEEHRGALVAKMAAIDPEWWSDARNEWGSFEGVAKKFYSRNGIDYHPMMTITQHNIMISRAFPQPWRFSGSGVPLIPA